MKPQTITILSVFAVAMAYLLSHSEILMLAEYTNPVAYSPETFRDMIQQPMGILLWAGCWITQLFHVPFLGALILSIIWAAITALLIKAWGLLKWNSAIAALPQIALLWSIGCLGYWMHYSNLSGYYIAHSLAVLIIATVLCISHKSKIIAIISPIILYPVLGYWAVVLGVAVSALNFSELRIRALIPSATAAISPIVWYALCYSKFVSAADIYTAGLPTLINNDVSGSWLLLPLHICALCMVAAPFFRNLKYETYISPSIACALLAVALLMCRHSEFFYKEIRMQSAAVDARWQDIIEIGDQSRQQTETMKVFYELAMAQTHTLGSHAFATRHTTVQNPESHAIKVKAMQIAAPIIHYYYGRYNISTRWCVEVGVKYGFGSGLLRILAMSALGNGEIQAARKYRDIIHGQIFFSHWNIPEPSQVTRDFNNGICNRLETDLECDEYLKYIATMPDNIHTQTAAELGMYYAMQDRNKTVFRQMAYSGYITDKPLQRHYQEACMLMLDSIPQGMVQPEVISDFRDFDAQIQRLQATQDKSLVTPIHQQFGNTYWWYVYFEK